MLKYGPVGNPESTDPFERAQAQAPKGWHVEGEIFGVAPRYMMRASGPASATSKAWVRAEGRDYLGTADALVAAMRREADCKDTSSPENRGTLSLLSDGVVVLGFPANYLVTEEMVDNAKAMLGQWRADGLRKPLAFPFPLDVVDLRAKP